MDQKYNMMMFFNKSQIISVGKLLWSQSVTPGYITPLSVIDQCPRNARTRLISSLPTHAFYENAKVP